MKTTRRKILKTIGVTTASAFLLPFFGCENYIIQPEPSSNETKISKAIDTVNNFCSMNSSGNYFGTLRKKNNFEIPAFDVIAVNDGYRIVSAVIREQTIMVTVEYKYLGVFNGVGFFKPKPNDNFIFAKYRVINGIVTNGQKPMLSKDAFRNHLKHVISGNPINIERYQNNEFMRNFFRTLEITYSDILNYLG